MPIGQAGALTFALFACLATWRSRRDWFWLSVGVALLANLAVGVWRYGLRDVLIAGPISGSVALASLLMGSLVWAHAVGLPRRVACVLGIGLMSRALLFSNELARQATTLHGAVNLAIDDPSRQSDLPTEAKGPIRRIRALQPPDATWASLRDDLADRYQASVDLISGDAPEQHLADHGQAFAQVMSRWADMIEYAARDQRALATSSRRRRASVTWLGTTGLSLLVLGLGDAAGHDLARLGPGAITMWLTLAEFAGAAILLLAAAVIGIRGRVAEYLRPS